ncbi:hypothetical protein FA15DRAFT_461509 [Coprinopsis marcescibilis]|uniref:DUF6533 domain-containing protein n=1 Tax=Coprinopsis marcescibilis TaxID=230819 RepID=A0A5C3KSL8_COPMA|nr:hypothetical protein FA15DRAFT_461509 [Coprinopsis marcescibilis]
MSLPSTFILSDILGPLVEGARNGIITKQFILASAVVWWLDYFETLQKEVDLVWGSQTSLVKILFFLSRYSVPIHLGFNSSFSFMMRIGKQHCAVAFYGSVVSALFNGTVSEALLYYQVYAFSHKNPILGIYLAVQFAIVWSSVLFVQIMYFRGLTFSAYGMGTIVNCVPQETKGQLMGIAFVISVLSVAVLVVITIVIIMRKYRNFKSALLSSFIRDGMLYLYAIAAMGIISAVLTYAGKDTIKWVMGTPKSVAYGVLASRMVLHLRHIAHKQARSGGVAPPFTSITFASPSRRPSIHFDTTQKSDIETFSLAPVPMPQSPIMGITVAVSTTVHVDNMNDPEAPKRYEHHDIRYE